MTIIAPAPTLTRTEEARRRAAAAHADYLASVRGRAADPACAILTTAELAEMHGRSLRWAQMRIAECAEQAAAILRAPNDAAAAEEAQDEAAAVDVDAAPVEPDDAPVMRDDRPEPGVGDGGATVGQSPMVDAAAAEEAPAPSRIAAAAGVVGEAVVAVAETATSKRPQRRRVVIWPVLVMILPATAAIWGGWVELGELVGFGVVDLLPGIADVRLNTAITLPIGMEAYAAYAMYVWLSGAAPARAVTFARASAFTALGIGAGGQVAYHLLSAAGMTTAPPWLVAVVACIPVAVVGLGGALGHMVRHGAVDEGAEEA